MRFLHNDDIITHRLDLKVNMPQKLGQFTKDYYGVEQGLGQEMKRPVFNQINREHMAKDLMDPMFVQNSIKNSQKVLQNLKSMQRRGGRIKVPMDAHGIVPKGQINALSITEGVVKTSSLPPIPERASS